MGVDEANEEEMDVQEEENHDLIPTVDDPIESKKCRYHIITVFNNPEVKIDKLPNNKAHNSRMQPARQRLKQDRATRPITY
nr:unnamed protein product [Callosobruchus analis]